MKYRRTKGFTLIELVIAVVLTAMVILVASAGARSLFDIKRRIISQNYLFSQAMTVLEQISQDINNMYKEKVGDSYNLMLKNGGGDNLGFGRLAFYVYTVPYNEDNKSCIKEVEYGLLKSKTDNSLYQLGRREALVEDISYGNDRGKVYIIADSVKSLTFECWDGENWSRELPEDGSLPEMLRVTIGVSDSIWATGESYLSKQISLKPIPLEMREYEEKSKKSYY